MLGLTDITRLDELRKSRDKAKALYEDNERARQIAAAGGVAGVDVPTMGKIRGLFDCSYELGERYEQLVSFSLPLADTFLQQRSKGKYFLEEVAKQEAERMAALREAGQRRWKRDRGDGDDGPGHFSGVPPVLREFLPRLPAHSGPIPDVEGFIRQLRAVVLPPRPSDDGDFGSSSLKRPRDESAAVAVGGSDWLAGELPCLVLSCLVLSYLVFRCLLLCYFILFCFVLCSFVLFRLVCGQCAVYYVLCALISFLQSLIVGRYSIALFLRPCSAVGLTLFIAYVRALSLFSLPRSLISS